MYAWVCATTWVTRRVANSELRHSWRTLRNGTGARWHATMPRKTSDALTRNADAGAVCVVVGGTRGIGAAIVRAVFERGWQGRVVAAGRTGAREGASPDLDSTRAIHHARLATVAMDVCDEAQIKRAVSEIGDWTGSDRVDLVVHCAGLLHEAGHMPERSLSAVDANFLRRNLEVNTIGAILSVKHLSPLMRTARKAGRVPSVYATLSARVGSIGDNGLGGWVSYRASKAAQNQAMRTASIELGRRGTICVSLHPGTVATNLSAPFEKNVRAEKLFTVDYAANMLLDVIDSLSTDDNGSFLAYDRSAIPW